MEVSGYLCTLTSAGLVGIKSSRNIYVPTITASHRLLSSLPNEKYKAILLLVLSFNSLYIYNSNRQVDSCQLYYGKYSIKPQVKLFRNRQQNARQYHLADLTHFLYYCPCRPIFRGIYYCLCNKRNARGLWQFGSPSMGCFWNCEYSSERLRWFSFNFF